MTRTVSTYNNLRIFNVAEGLREGLSHYSNPSRVAVVYAIRPTDPLFVYDPQGLLQGHEPKLKELYITDGRWRNRAKKVCYLNSAEPVLYEKDQHLTGLISYGGCSRAFFYQMWFAEHHPDMCSIGPTLRWMEHAVWLLHQDFLSDKDMGSGSSTYVLREYATHAVRDYIVDERNRMMGLDTRIRIYPILDTILELSATREEGAAPRGLLVFVEPSNLKDIRFLAKFPREERPSIKNIKHVRKMLVAVENSTRKLISDGAAIIGVARGELPGSRIVADFRGGHGFLHLNQETVCSFSDGSFHSTTRRAKLVQVEEALLESNLDRDTQHALYQVVSYLVHRAEEKKFGCTLVVKLSDREFPIAGQRVEEPLDLRRRPLLKLASSLAHMDGALMIGADVKLHGFACLLDGLTCPGEDRARGARFNSALRFTNLHPDVIVVVVSSDRPVSVMQQGMELSAQCAYKPSHGYLFQPPTLDAYTSRL